MNTATCTNCGQPKSPENYADHVCPTCTETKTAAMTKFSTEHPEAAHSDVLYAGRQALLTRAHHANRNFIDPRGFSGRGGQMPSPNPSNTGSTR